MALGRSNHLLAKEMTLLVASASCWHLIFSAVAFSNADVKLLRLALSSWKNKVERPQNNKAGLPGRIWASHEGLAPTEFADSGCPAVLGM